MTEQTDEKTEQTAIPVPPEVSMTEAVRSSHSENFLDGMRPPKSDARRLYVRLFVISFASLFWEMFLIRWLTAELPFLSYFRSLIILAAFFGMGLGCILYSRTALSDRTLVNLFLAGACLLFVVVALAGDELRERGFGSHSGILQQGTPGSVPRIPDFTLEFEGVESRGEIVVVGMFIFVAALFVPVGLIIARLFEQMPPILAYAINISGALLGTLLFIPISFAQLGPHVWSVIGLASLLVLLRPTQLQLRASKALILGLAVSGVALFAICVPNSSGQIIWSPYQRVSWANQYLGTEDSEPKATGTLLRSFVFVNYEYHQQIVNLAHFESKDQLHEFSRSIGEDPNSPDTLMGFMSRYYRPYEFINPRSVLIIAAGNGNEAAAALRHGAEEIDAVEIDPGIIEVGRRYHPEEPYESPGVTVVCDDARAFLQRTKKKYDLIVMNAVDSHYQFATSAGLRLDSYIFTIEFFRQVRQHLAPDGIFALEFSGFHWNRVPWAKERLSEILWRTFGFRPTAQNTYQGARGPQFIIYPQSRPAPDTYNKHVRVSTDDWPQFYLRIPRIPTGYLHVVIAVLFISLLVVLSVQPDGEIAFDGHFFFLGAAFMLLEIKSISELSLTFGATWLVSSLVIAAILLAIGMATLVVLRWGDVPYYLGYAIILGSLVVSIYLGPSAFLGLGFASRALCASLKVAVPVFGAGLVFASSFRRTKRPSAALGWNLLGAMVGGLGEYLSLMTGVSGLGVCILGLYSVSWLMLYSKSLRAFLPVAADR